MPNSRHPASDRQGKSAATPNRARVVWHEPCQSREAPGFSGSTRRELSFETSPNPRSGEVSKTQRNYSARGGARNCASRESRGLKAAQIANLIAASAHAAAIGLPFTRMVTIHWEAAGVPLADMAKATGRYTDLMAKALARNGCGAAWLWIHENGDGKGGHCHLLAHVPADLVSIMTGLQRGWLRRITGRPYRARVILSRPIGGWLGLEATNPDLHRANLVTAIAYLLKGASPEAASQFALERLEPGGRVIGKRCSTSQNIGAKARAVARGRPD
jgi:hypothetical protein